ncbi:MAG: phosphopantetheine adenylyltransferase [Methanobacteriaceae archaeon]|nr:phosphopantetheine adenylyltransferase [Methanobacteriaceae archaeon]
MSGKKYQKVAVGGTFDKFHQGHRILLEKAFQMGEEVLVGVTSDEFGGQKGEIEPCNVRMSNLNALLSDKSGYLIARLEEPYGPTVDDETMDAIVVSPETEATAREINKIRQEKGMKPLNVVIIGMVLAEDGRPISSTRIRKGEIEPDGTVVHK